MAKNFQDLMNDIYFLRDKKRGVEKTFIWFVEEVGELARALRNSETDRKNLEEEFADVYAWLCSLGNLCGVDLEEVAYQKYPLKCSKCNKSPCECPSL